MLSNKKIILALTGMLYAGMMHAASYVYSDSNVAVIIQENVPCTNKKVMQSIKIVGEPFASWQWGEASVLFEGQTIKACFSSDPAGVFIIDEQGNGGVIPNEMFRKLKET